MSKVVPAADGEREFRGGQRRSSQGRVGDDLHVFSALPRMPEHKLRLCYARGRRRRAFMTTRRLAATLSLIMLSPACGGTDTTTQTPLASGGSGGAAGGGSGGASASGGAAASGGATGSLCGGVVCGPAQVCCGPPDCGQCIPENSGQFCPDMCTSCDQMHCSVGTVCICGGPGATSRCICAPACRTDAECTAKDPSLMCCPRGNGCTDSCTCTCR